jgi:predicted ribonuclease YlaK
LYQTIPWRYNLIIAGQNTICSIAIEPNFENTLSWLSPDNNDDRIIASCFGVIKKQPHSIVILITADINMQNKADFAKINFLEPPESI